MLMYLRLGMGMCDRGQGWREGEEQKAKQKPVNTQTNVNAVLEIWSV